MTRSTRDVVFGLLGGAVLFGVLVVATLPIGNNEGGEAYSPTSASAAGTAPTVGADTVVAVTGTSSVTSAALVTTTTAGLATTLATVMASLTIGQLETTESELWEAAAACAGSPHEAEVSFPIAGPNSVVGVVLGWGVDGPDFDMEWVELIESAPGRYSYTLGPFAEDTVDNGAGELIVLAAEAVDAADEGAYIEWESLILLHDCEGGA